MFRILVVYFKYPRNDEASIRKFPGNNKGFPHFIVPPIKSILFLWEAMLDWAARSDGYGLVSRYG